MLLLAILASTLSTSLLSNKKNSTRIQKMYAGLEEPAAKKLKVAGTMHKAHLRLRQMTLLCSAEGAAAPDQFIVTKMTSETLRLMQSAVMVTSRLQPGVLSRTVMNATDTSSLRTR